MRDRVWVRAAKTLNQSHVIIIAILTKYDVVYQYSSIHELTFNFRVIMAL